MFERFTAGARAVVVAAQAEARALQHGRVGTEHLLLGLLGEPGGPAGGLLAARGIAAGDVRAAVERSAGRGEPELDADALATLGIDLDEVRVRVERAFGPGALSRRPCRRGLLDSHPAGLPFTPRAKKALELALREAIALGDRHIGSEHVLLGLIRAGDGVAARILGERGVDRGAVLGALARDRAG
jgi:ATP-dependent Clp protease ATP-binding subunit ClpA